MRHLLTGENNCIVCPLCLLYILPCLGKGSPDISLDTGDVMKRRVKDGFHLSLLRRIVTTQKLSSLRRRAIGVRLIRV
jgi:hypothetical protein